jgi:hypothetical protein
MTRSSPPGSYDLESPPTRTKHELVKSLAPATFGPREIARLRAQAAGIVTHLLPNVMEAVEGKRTWTPVQANLFKTLWQSVMPTLSQSHTTVDINAKPLAELSRDDIEKMLAEAAPDEVELVEQGDGQFRPR